MQKIISISLKIHLFHAKINLCRLTGHNFESDDILVVCIASIYASILYARKKEFISNPQENLKVTTNSGAF